MRYFYFAYGMLIRSAVKFPELIPASEGLADLTIRVGKIHWSPLTSSDSANPVVLVDAGMMHFFWPGVGKFLARGGREIVVDPLPGIEESLLRLFLLGAVLAGVLHQRGLLLLHASALKIGNSAVVFMGEKGQGKSTLAASIQLSLESPNEILADDIVAIDIMGSSSCFVLPGFPQFKLWPDVIASLGVNSGELTPIHPHLTKRAYRTLGKFALQPVSLQSIYVLTDGDGATINLLSPRDAFIELFRYSYLGRHLPATGLAPRHFDQCAIIAKSVPVSSLKRPRSLELLPKIASFVSNDVDRIAALRTA
jgi:hypothetical protein